MTEATEATEDFTDDEFDVESDTGAFAAVPVRALTVIGSNPRALQCYVMLVARADNRGTCYPSHSWLARKMGCSVASVRRAIDELRDAGLVRRKTRRRLADGEDGAQTSNLYQVVRYVKPDPPSTSEQGGAHPREGVPSTSEQPLSITSDLDPPLPPRDRKSAGSDKPNLRCSACGVDGFESADDVADHQEQFCAELRVDEGGTFEDAREILRSSGGRGAAS